MTPPPPRSTLFPYTTLFRSRLVRIPEKHAIGHLAADVRARADRRGANRAAQQMRVRARPRSEEHTSELQSHSDLVCRLLLEKKKKTIKTTLSHQATLHRVIN